MTDRSPPGGISTAPVIRPRVKVWIEADGQSVFCSGLCRILQAIAETGSIKASAGLVGQSYRHIWARLKEAEAALGQPLVASQVGGRGSRRTTLSAAGAALLQAFLELRGELLAASDRCADRLAAALPQLREAPLPEFTAAREADEQRPD